MKRTNESAISRTLAAASSHLEAKKWVSIGALTCLSVLLFAQPTLSADYNKSSSSKNTAVVEGEFGYQEIKKYQQLPDVPQYSGQADFVQGVVYPAARGGSSTTYNLAVRESRAAVVHWYKDALKMYKWNLAGEQSNDGVRGYKGSSFCQVMVAAPTRQGYGCDLIITYRTVVQ